MSTSIAAGVYALALLVVASEPVSAGSLTFEPLASPSLPEEDGRPVYVAVQIRDEVRIDGDLSEWDEMEPIELGAAHGAQDWSGTDDLSARAHVAWSTTHLYFACEVVDDSLSLPAPDEGIWTGDAIQMAFDPLGDGGTRFGADDYNLGMALTVSGPSMWYFSAPAGPGRVPLGRIQLAVVRRFDDTGYVYEMAVPWGELAPLVPLVKAQCGFSFVIADNDGEGFEGGLQWTEGIWWGQRPGAFAHLVFESSPPPEGVPAEVLMGTDNEVIRPGHEVRVDLAVNASAPARGAQLEARISVEGDDVAQLAEPLDVAAGVTHLALIWPVEDEPTGEYAVDVAVSGADGVELGQGSFALFLLGDLPERTRSRLDGHIERIVSRGEALDSPLLKLRALDVRRCQLEALSILDQAVARQQVESALPIAAQGDLLARAILEGEAPDDEDHFLLAMALDPEAATIWEPTVQRGGPQNVGVYFAGIPIGHIWRWRHTSEEEARTSLENQLQWRRDQGQTAESSQLGEYETHIVATQGQLHYLGMLRGSDLYSISAISLPAARMVATELASLDGVTAAEIDAMRTATELHSEVDAQHLGDILSFGYGSAALVVGDEATSSESRLADDMVRKLGCELVSESHAPADGNLILIGSRKTNGLVERYEKRDLLQYPHPDQGLLTHFSLDGRRIVAVAARDAESVIDAGELLIDLVSVLSERTLLVGDLHMHTNHSDGVSAPVVVATATMRNYMDFASITDHNTVTGTHEAIERVRETGIEYTLIPGQETTTTWSHFVVLGCEDTISWHAPAEEIMRSTHEAGGIIIWAHPGYPESEWAEAALADWMASGLDAFEARGRTLEVYPGWKKLERMPSLVSSSDSHSTTFSAPDRTLVFAPQNTPEAIIEAVRTGYCLGYTGQEAYGPDFLLDIYRILLEEGEYLKEAHMQRLTARVATLF